MNDPAPTPTIRDAGPADLGAVVRIERLSFSDPWTVSALLSELVSDPLRLTLVAESADTVCGYLMAWCVVDQLHILNLAVDPDQRRTGAGTALLIEAARRGLQRGLVEATLEVRRSNSEAIGFYLSHGLQEVGIRPRYYQDNREDAVLMSAPLLRLLGAEGPREA